MVRVHTHTRTHRHTHTRTQTHTCAHMHTQIHAHTPTHTSDNVVGNLGFPPCYKKHTHKHTLAQKAVFILPTNNHWALSPETSEHGLLT